MKLAEALLLRSEIQKKIESLKQRLERNAVVQQGDQPSEQPAALFDEAERLLTQFENLLFAINRTNLGQTLADGTPLTQALARRDALVQRHRLTAATIENTVKRPDVWGTREIRWLPTVNVADLQKQADDLARQIRELNSAIQAANWQAEIEL
jgi:hypothetical protein